MFTRESRNAAASPDVVRHDGRGEARQCRAEKNGSDL
jgi:hypothetical protein